MISSRCLNTSSLLAISLLAIAPASQSANFAANVLSDSVDAAPGDGICADDSGRCSLRAAIMESNALPGRDSITLSLSGTYQLSIPGTGENAAATGDLDIRDNINIAGQGADLTFVDGGGLDRVFHVLPVGVGIVTASFSKLTIQHGNPDVNGAGDSGGGIEVGDGTVSGNTLAVLKDVVVRDNIATFGGGVFNGFLGSLTVTTSTIGPGNVADYGGGTYSRDARQVVISNSTISGNTANGGGGGMDLFNGATALLNGVTVADNTATLGGGIFRESSAGPAALQNTILGDNVGNNCLGTMLSRGNNLSSDTTCQLNQASDLPNTGPQLTALGNHGGHTLTHSLAPGSPAASHIPLASCAPIDQRHVTRPQIPTNTACDIGAVETAQ